MEFSAPLSVTETPIAGLLIFKLTVHGDNRGWFKENWHRHNQACLKFTPVQNNISFNTDKGVTRGLHAEPWDKYISVATGSVFGAWCDLRSDSPTYGRVFSTIITPDIAVFVPRGVANGFQALEPTAYTYLVNDHWSTDGQYSFVNLADPALGIDWPIPLDQCELSQKDRDHPVLAEAIPVEPKKILITGGGGQLATALQKLLPHAEVATKKELDICTDLLTAKRWQDYSTIINTAAYTAVDAAEHNREQAWAVNAHGVSNLAKIAAMYRLKLVHISTDYVFSGTQPYYCETDAIAPLNVYGQSKAAGEQAAISVPDHLLIRTSWVVGSAKNFVRTMAHLAATNVEPQVVNDQFGRLTFTADLAAAIVHLLKIDATGTFHMSNSGDIVSWADIAAETFRLLGYNPNSVQPVSTAEYFGNKPHAPRPTHSGLDLTKLSQTGFTPPDWRSQLAHYLEELS